MDPGASNTSQTALGPSREETGSDQSLNMAKIGLERDLKVFQFLEDLKPQETDKYTSCKLCHRDYVVGSNSEYPVKLPCGHSFGIKCLKTQLPQLKYYATCPNCHVLVFESTPPRTFEATVKDRIWLGELVNAPLRSSGLDEARTGALQSPCR